MLKPHNNNFSNVVSALSSKTSKDLSLFEPIITSYDPKQFQYKQVIKWHGLNVTLYLQSEAFLNEIKNYFPTLWLGCENESLPSVYIYIFDDRKCKIPHSFWFDEDPSCHLYQNLNTEWACQRDFVARKSENEIVAICKNNISDGFFNLMRWVLPRFWLSNNQFLFHSSCVLNSEGEAYLCLGPSGAGKTTISKFLPQEQVLGDDMNLLTIDGNGKVWVTPSLLGQSYESNTLFGKNFPLNDIFWITKSNENKIIINNDLSLRLKVCMSLVNIFWSHLSDSNFLSIQGLIMSLNKKYELKELQFSLDKGVWDYVFSVR